jgi:hypothetical protein
MTDDAWLLSGVLGEYSYGKSFYLSWVLSCITVPFWVKSVFSPVTKKSENSINFKRSKLWELSKTFWVVIGRCLVTVVAVNWTYSISLPATMSLTRDVYEKQLPRIKTCLLNPLDLNMTYEIAN